MITVFKNRNMNLFLVATLGIALVAAIAVLLSARVPINLIDNQLSDVHTDPKAGMDTYLNSERTSSPVRTVWELRLWSSEVFLSDNNNPDSDLNSQYGAIQDLQNACMSEDSLPRRYSGCVE